MTKRPRRPRSSAVVVGEAFGQFVVFIVSGLVAGVRAIWRRVKPRQTG